MSSNNNRLTDIEFRPLREHERFAYYRNLHRGFNSHFTIREGDLEYDKKHYGMMSPTMCAFDGDEIVGTSSWVQFELTVPGTQTNFMGVTDVTVASTHRRRGIMREMMRRLLSNGQASGQHIAGLWASESNIYNRFGYGLAGEQQIAKIETLDARFRTMPSNRGSVRFADAAKMRQIAPEVWERARLKTPGMMKMQNIEWERTFDPARLQKVSGPKHFFVVYSEGDEPLGYAIYKIKEGRNGLDLNNKLEVNELVAATASAEANLWRYLLDVDLIDVLVHEGHPKKSMLLWLLADPRKLSLQPYDALWIRILDPVKALLARSYANLGEVAIEVFDDFCDGTEGIYLLTVDKEGSATCTRTDRPPDVSMPIASLGSIYMGAMLLSDLARADRAVEHSEGAVAMIDTMFPISGAHCF